MIIVGICGASGSGKSTLAKEIEDSLTCTSAIIGLDCYYRDHSDLPFEERVHINYDEPDIFDFDQLYADIQRLQGGLPITRKGYLRLCQAYAGGQRRADTAHGRAHTRGHTYVPR